MRHLNKKATAIFTEITRRLGENESLKLDNAPGAFMPLSVDRTGPHTFALAHYGEQNGDLMADPDMTFFADPETGYVCPLSYQNDYMGMYVDAVKEWHGPRPEVNEHEQALLVKTAEIWMLNIADQQGIAPAPVTPAGTERPAPLSALAAAIEQSAARPAEQRPAASEAPRPVAAAQTEPAPVKTASAQRHRPDAADGTAPFTANVNAAYVYQAGKCRANDPYSAMSGINLCPAPDGHGVLIAGCDGHRLICMFDAGGFVSRPGTIYPDKTFWQAMKPRKGRADGRLTVTARAVGELARPDEMTIRQEAITHDRHPYPDILVFLARARDARPLTGPLALPAPNLAAMTIDGPERGRVALYATGDEGPVFVRDFNEPDYLGIIMPLKQWKHVDGRREALLDAPARPVPAWAMTAAGFDAEPAPEIAAPVEEPTVAPETKPIKAPESTNPTPVAKATAPAPRKTRKARVSIAANIASRKRSPAPTVDTPAPAPVNPAPVSLPVMATPAPTLAPAEIIIAPAWLAHAYQMHAYPPNTSRSGRPRAPALL